MATKGSISMEFELRSPERAVVYVQVRKIVISAFSEDGQASSSSSLGRGWALLTADRQAGLHS